MFWAASTPVALVKELMAAMMLDWLVPLAKSTARNSRAFRENNQRVWHVEPAYTESIYGTVMSGTIVVRATETSFGIEVSRDGPPQ